MVDEAHLTPDGEQADAEAAQSAQSTFIARNWPLPAFAIGTVVLIVATWLWLGPMTAHQKDRFLTDLARARAQVESNPYSARSILGGLMQRRWRVPEARGEIFYLLGLANQQLAHDAENDPESIKQYQTKAAEALKQAVESGVPEADELGLEESYGRSIVQLGESTPKELANATTSLLDALGRRDVIAWVITRRQLEALASLPNSDSAQLRRVADHWRDSEEIPNSLAAISRQAVQLIDQKNNARLIELLGSDELESDWNQNVQAVDADQTLATSIELGELDEAIEKANQLRAENNTRRAAILGALSQASTKLDPPKYADAIRYAKRRIALPNLSNEEVAAGKLAYADVLLEDGKPELVREQLSGLQGTPAQRRRAMYLTGRALLEAGSKLERSDLRELAKSNKSMKALLEWSKQQRALASSQIADESLSNRVRETLLNFMEPSNLKEIIVSLDFQRAIDTFTQLLEDEDLTDEESAETRLWIGVAKTDLGKFSEARADFQATIQEIGSGPLEQAARFYLANCESRAGMPAEAITTLREAVATVRNPRRYDNKYLRPTQLRDVLIEMWNREENISHDFTNAIAVATIFGDFRMPCVEPGQPDELLAMSCSSLARHLDERASETDDPSLRRQLGEESRARNREAGHAYLAVTKAREGSDEYPALLWDAALHLFDGHDFAEAIPTFEKFLVAHVNGPRDFLGRMYLTRSYLAEGKYTQAREVMEEALKQTTNAIDRFRGRILLAECYSEIARNINGDSPEVAAERKSYLELSEGLLRRNLNGQNQELEPSAAEWRESLFALGKLLFELHRYDESVELMSEYVRRYPKAPRSVDAQNIIGESYLASAVDVGRKLDDPNMSTRERARIEETRMQLLELANQEFRGLVNELTTAADKSEISRQGETLLEGALFRMGRIYALLGEWENALQTYEDLAYRYQDRPDCLAAYIEMSTAFQKLGRESDAESSLRQALWVLDQIDAKAFAETGENREEIRRQIQILLGTP